MGILYSKFSLLDPFLEMITHKIEQFEEDNRDNKKIISRFDEVLCEKASKVGPFVTIF